MKKPDKREHINLFFSAFLIIAFIICANFFASFTATTDAMTSQLISIAVYAVFGLLLFYATRVGDGKASFRFSPLTLIVLVLPALFIIIASLAEFMPLHGFFAADTLTGKLSLITSLAAVAIGYGIPYSFVSGFELAPEEAADENDSESAVLEGGIEADLLEAEEDVAEDESEDEADDGFTAGDESDDEAEEEAAEADPFDAQEAADAENEEAALQSSADAEDEEE